MTLATQTAFIPTARRRRSSVPLYVLLGLVVASAISYQAGVIVGVLHSLKVSVPDFELRPGSAEVDTVTPHARNAGLQPGDVLIAVDGRPYTGTAVLAQEQAKAVPGGSVELTVRGADRQQRSIDLHVTRPAGSLRTGSMPILLFVIMPPICLVLGAWVVLVRPHDKLAWLLLGMLLTFTQLFGAGRIIEAWTPGVRELAMSYHEILGSTWPIFMFLFGFYFPEPFPPSHRIFRWRRMAWILSALLIISGIVDAVVMTGQITSYSAVAPLYRATRWLQIVAEVLSYAGVSAFFCFIFMKSYAESQFPADARRRLRLLYWGTTIAMTPALAISLLAAIRKTPFEQFPAWLTYPSLFMLLLFPLTLAYVIVVQRAMDVRIVVRQGLQYGLTTTGIRVLQITITAVVIIAAVNLAQGHGASAKRNLLLVLVVAGLLLTIRRAAERLRSWTDRRFFREAYNAEQVLSELSDHVRSMLERRPLIETVATRIADTLHVHNVAVLLGAGGTYRAEFMLGYAASPEVVFPLHAGTIQLLQAQREPARIYFDDPDSWLYRNPEISDDDRSRLAQLRAELLLPLSGRDKLLGFISLGAKRSDEPYSGNDVRLLKSVAAQTGLALENARLMAAIAEEVAQRERLNREVEIAREVQERLFPQTLPPIAGLSYAGACRPALGVGGDYYDFLALPEGQLGIAIGDVSGKGIAAALMMASLQASLRSEATRAPDDLAALVSNVNRLVYEASSANRYATFFYAQYNPDSLRLTYVNAGHNPPILLRCSNGLWQISRLQTGGTVVGLMPNSTYEQGAVTLAAGDLLVAFTDGITEAMNAGDEEWGEERLVEAVKCCAILASASEIIPRIMQAADAFVAGAKQHDDMTLVILRCDCQPA